MIARHVTRLFGGMALLLGTAVSVSAVSAQEADPPEPPTREEMGIDILLAELRAVEEQRATDPANGELAYMHLGALYLVGVQEEWAVKSGLALLDSIPVALADTALSTAYRGAFTTLLGKHAFWPHSKLGHVRSGLSLLDRAVDVAPESARIRYLRLMSGYYLPGIFGRGDEVREDFGVLAGLLPLSQAEFPPRLYVEVCRFVLEHGGLGEPEKEALRRALEEV